MRIVRLALIIAACAGMLVTTSPTAFALDGVPTLTVSQLSPGMRGIGKTVVVGTDVDTFDFEILGILEKGGFNGGPMILIRCWGSAIEKSGGIAGGYSGSPLFIDGKLIGALSAGWYFTEGDIAGVTPIHEMLKTFNYPESPRMKSGEGGGTLLKETTLSKPISHSGHTFGKVLLAQSEKQLEGCEFSDDTLVMVESKTPLVVGGLSDKYFPLVKEALENRMPYFEVIQGPASGRIPTNLTGAKLEPGAAIGVQLVSGDIDMTAIGTLTYIDDQGRILAFGHPFMQKGYIEMPLASARIIKTVPSIQRSFKMGEAIEMVGRIEQDRGTCVAGHIGVMADTLDIKVTVKDEDIDWKNTYQCKVIRDGDMMPFYWLIPPLEALGRTMDRSGGGLINVTFKVYADGFEKPISMTNVFYAPEAYGAYYSVSELGEILNALTSRNIFRDARISSVELEIEVRDEHRTIDILKATSIMPPEKEAKEEKKGEEAKPGEGGKGKVEEPLPVEPSGKEKSFEFVKRNIPDRALLNLASTALGREIIRLNAGDEALGAIKEYIETKEKEEDKFYKIPQYYPGDTIEATVLCQPYRKEAFERKVSLQIPKDFPAGTYDVNICGGSSFFGGMMPGMEFPMMMMMGMPGMGPMPGMTAPKSLEEMIEDMTDREPNNELIISLGPIMDEDPYAYLREGYELPKPIKAVFPMDAVVYGSFFLPVEILTAEGEEAEGGETTATKAAPSPKEEGKLEIDFKNVPQG